MLASFDRTVGGGVPELTLVSGYSGIGKSSVVNELHKVLVPPRALFGSGKFDRYKPDIPYATLAQAFQNLIRPLLSKSEAELSKWRDALRDALGAIMSTIGVVREKETGSIANFYSTPTTKFEFLFGKQLPYIAVATVSFVFMLILAIYLFDVPVKGSLWTLALGTLLCVAASTGFGQLVSTFTRTQVSAVFATIVIAIIPAANFSRLLVPVFSLSGGGRVLGLGFPSTWYQPINVGTFSKARDFDDLWLNLMMLAIFFVLYLVAAKLILRKQKT